MSTARAWLVSKDVIDVCPTQSFKAERNVSDWPDCLFHSCTQNIFIAGMDKNVHLSPALRGCRESDGQPDSLAGAWMEGDLGRARAERPGIESRRAAMWRSQDLLLGHGTPRLASCSDRVRTALRRGGDKPGGERWWGEVGTRCWNPGEVSGPGTKAPLPHKHQ